MNLLDQMGIYHYKESDLLDGSQLKKSRCRPNFLLQFAFDYPLTMNGLLRFATPERLRVAGLLARSKFHFVSNAATKSRKRAPTSS